MGRSEYERVRAARLECRAGGARRSRGASRLVGRADWAAHRDRRLRSLLAYARERSPFYADRLRGIDVEEPDLASIPMLTKAEAQGCWDAIVTTPDLNREAAERILNEQPWFSYTRHDGAGVQFRRLQRCARGVCLGLAILRQYRVPRVAHAGPR